MLGLIICIVLTATEEQSRDIYGGWQELKGEATGFFHTQQIDGIHWLVDPDGNVFISKGVNHVSYSADNAPKLGYSPYGRATAEKYGSADAWAEAVAERLKGWGFNTIGAWSSGEMFQQKMPYTVILNLAVSTGGDWQRGLFPDVFSDKFRDSVFKSAEQCARFRDDPFLLGYFTDNELRWGPDWRSIKGLLADFWELPAESAGKKKAVKFLQDFYGKIEKFNEVWGTQFSSFDELEQLSSLKAIGEIMTQAHWGLLIDNLLKDFLKGVPKETIVWYLNQYYDSIDDFNKDFGTDFKSYDEALDEKQIPPQADELRSLESGFLKMVAEQYFKICADAIRKYDPNHMILGCRYAGYAPDEVVESMGDNVDVISYNNYNFLPPVEKLQRIYDQTGKPMMITEFSFKAMDSGLPNTRGAGQPVETQQDRADKFDAYVTALMKLPYMVGFHWFEHADEPAEGRFDGENSNYGLVNIKDEPWEVLTERMRDVNDRLELIHLCSVE